MAKLSIESIDFADEAFQPLVSLITNSVGEAFKLQQKRAELPVWMNKKQACEYCNVAYNTLTGKLIPNGLKVSIVDGIERISKEACDEFLKKHEI
ncbi:helix-turn-helix domain-containing protein [Enterococcus sp. AZ196]|uniref:helix-turn-helix domain-containing protein n=1 Tax=Enterococcus sp. AZ196 TaxID=2774659 RepID=UPI003D29AFF4